MTERIVRRGVRAPGEYTADFLDQVRVLDCALRPVVTLRAEDTVERIRAWLGSGAEEAGHQGFPVVDQSGKLLGVLTRRDIAEAADVSMHAHELVRRECVVVFDDSTLRDAADRMARERIGRLPVLSRSRPHSLVGIITRSDLVDAHLRRLEEHRIESTRMRSRLLQRAKAREADA